MSLNRKQRRAAQAMVRRDLALSTAQALSAKAHEILTTNLTSPDFGNVLSTDHAEALMRVVGGMSLLATGAGRTPESSQRVAYPLDTGLGKTQSVVAWIAAVHELGLPLSVAVAASQIEDLAELHRHLLKNGVPEKSIALWHSKKYDPAKVDAVLAGDHKARGSYASIPRTPDEELNTRPFLLCSHEYIRRGHDLTYNRKRRDLIVWDESLFTSSHRAVNLDELRGVVAYLAEQRRAREDGHPLQAAVAWLSEVKAMLTAEQERQNAEPDSSPRPLTLPCITAREVVIGEWLEAIDRAARRRFDMTPVKLLLTNETEARVLQTGKEAAMVAFHISIPDAVRPIAVLDASATIRELQTADRSIEVDRWFAERELKRYSKVTGHLWRTGAGRESLEKTIKAKCAEVAKLVAGLPDDEGALFFTRIPVGRETPNVDTLKDALADAGVDIGEKLADGKPRFGFRTFGSESSTNAWAHARHVFFVGAMFRGDADVAAALTGQRRDLLGPITEDERARIIRSEVAHTLYQGLSRGACRVVRDGEAAAMNFYMMLAPEYVTAVRGLLDQRMPGLAWVDWVSAPPVTDAATRAIVGYLSRLPAEVGRVSSREVRAAACPDVSDTTYQRARDAALVQLPGWRRPLDGQSFVRVC